MDLCGDFLGDFVLAYSSRYFFPAGHRSLFRHTSHLGLIGRHVCWPKPTSSQLTSSHFSLGSHSSSALRVASGVLVPPSPVQPRRLLMR